MASAAATMWSRVASWARASVTTVRVPLNQPFSRQLAADVDPAYAVEWSQISGLPAWASLSPTGLLTGTGPAAEESHTVSYAVRTTNPPSPYSYGSFVLSAANPEPMVSSGGQSTCEVRSDTSLYCWGNAAYGQVGDGQTKDRIVPQVVGTLGWASVSASGSTACGIRLDQTLWCWGMNHRGQLGIGETPRQLAPVQVAPGSLWSQVATGWLNTCAVGVDSSLWCWGDNSRGQVGVGDTRTRYTPALVSPSGMVVGDHRRLLRVRHEDRRHRQLLGPELLRPARHRGDHQQQRAGSRGRWPGLAGTRRRLGDRRAGSAPWARPTAGASTTLGQVGSSGPNTATPVRSRAAPPGGR